MTLSRRFAKKRWQDEDEKEETEDAHARSRREALRLGLGALGAGALGFFVGSKSVRAFSNPPTVGTFNPKYVSLIPQASQPSDAPDGALYLGTDELYRMVLAAGVSARKIPKLDATDLMLAAWLGTGTPDGTKVLYGDRTWGTLPAGSPHTILSTTHTDTLADSVLAGDILYGNSTPKWARLPKGVDGKVLTLSGGLPAWVTAGAPAASYYGVRAEDYITSGDGSFSNPWNASAIESAINALPAKGGIVFVKSGIWSGTRIYLGGTGQAGRGKYIILRGEGANLSYAAQESDADYNSAQVGTHLQCGFEIKLPACTVDFYNLTLSPPRGSYLTPTIKSIRDGSDLLYGQQRDVGGFRVMDCKFTRGHPAIWITGVNIPSHPDPVMQTWMVAIERCHFQGGGTGIKIDKGDSVTSSSYDLGCIRQINMNARGLENNTRAVNIDIDNVGALTFQDWLLEGCGGASTDYALYFKTARAESGFLMQNIFTGDGSNAIKDAYIEMTYSGGMARQLFFTKDVDLKGYGDFEIGYPWSSSAVVNVNAGGVDPGGIILRRSQGSRLVVGTNTNPQYLKRCRTPSAVGYLGTTTPSGSPYTYTNLDSYDEYAVLVGGTVSDVTRGGQSCGTERTHFLAPGDSIVITYSSAPSIKRFGVS